MTSNLETEQIAAALADANRRSADYAMVVDLIGCLTRIQTEKEAIEHIFDVFTALCAPAKLIYIPLLNGKVGGLLTRPDSLAEREAPESRLDHGTQDVVSEVVGDGFRLRITHQGDALGVLDVDSIAFPEYRDRYFNLALAISGVCGLAISDARKYEEIKHAEAERERLVAALRESEAQYRRLNEELEQRVISRTEQLQESNQQLLNEIAERRRAETELQKAHDTLELRVKERTAELERSNADLQQFAYVASHDLQEPLRMVSSYVQLLGTSYKGKLDADADEFIGYAVDGATRMQALINGLLSYSRIGRLGRPPEPTSAAAALDLALSNLRLTIEESGTTVTCDPLPIVLADTSQLVQLFQNLISNAIKFHGPQPPRVHVSVDRRESEWVFAVRDNGIGISADFHERIFAIFQRLHRRTEYPGTGIGLAICKKIVERHGGGIWVESQPGQGSAFCFTLPATAQEGL